MVLWILSCTLHIFNYKKKQQHAKHFKNLSASSALQELHHYDVAIGVDCLQLTHQTACKTRTENRQHKKINIKQKFHILKTFPINQKSQTVSSPYLDIGYNMKQKMVIEHAIRV